VKDQIRHHTLPSIIWRKLKQLYEPTNLSTQFDYAATIFRASLNDHSSVSDYCAILENAAANYTASGPAFHSQFPSHLLALFALMGLPPSYKVTQRNILSRVGTGALNLDAIKGDLLNEERLQAREAAEADRVANAMQAQRHDEHRRGPRKGKPKTPEEKAKYAERLKNVVCYYCRGIGHTIAACPKRIKDAEKTSKSHANQVTTNTEDDSSNDDEVEIMLAEASIGGVAAAYVSPISSPRCHAWVIDSGCSHHMTPLLHYFTSYHPYPTPRQIHLADKSSIQTLGEGTIALTTIANSKHVRIELKGALHVPALTNSLLSVKTLTRRGHSAVFSRDKCCIQNASGKIIAESKGGGNLYDLRVHHTPYPTVSIAKSSRFPLDLIHKRLGHPSPSTLRKMIKLGYIKGFSAEDLKELNGHVCDACMRAKMTRAPFQLGHKRATKRLQRVHSDLCGEFEHPTLAGNRYFATLIDDFSGMTWVRPLKHKKEFYSWFVKMDMMFLNQYGTHIGTLRADNGGEYTTRALREYCENNGILLEFTIPDTPEQNGVAERTNRTLTEKMRAMMKDRGSPPGLWGEAVCTAAYCLNRTSATANNGVTPYEIFEGNPPDISHLRTFYCDAYIHRTKRQGAQKLGDRALKVKFVGYPDSVSGYKFWDPHARKMRLSRSARFLETVVLPRPEIDISTEQSLFLEEDTYPPDLTTDDDSSSHHSDVELDDVDHSPTPTTPENTPDNEQQQRPPNEPPARQLRDRSQLRPPLRLDPSNFGAHGRRIPVSSNAEATTELCAMLARHDERNNATDDLTDNPTLNMALAGKERDKWIEAIKKELDNIKAEGVYDLVDPKTETIENLLGSKMVLRRKRGKTGKIERYKACLTARGDLQRENIDYAETFAPVVKSASLRVFFALCAKLGLKIRHMDVTSAFLNGSLKETVYMRQPKGFEEPGKETWVWKLKRALYGLKQGGREWYQCINEFFTDSLGFTRTFADHSIYVYDAHGSTIIIPLYVDDLLIGYSEDEQMQCIKTQLEARFKMVDVGAASWVLGMRVTNDHELGRVTLDQTQYIHQVLQRFGMMDCKPASTPLPEKETYVPATEEEILAARDYPYLSVLGSVMYAMLGTRPDIAYAVSTLSRYASNPGTKHVRALKHLLRYLKGTQDYGIVYSRYGGTLIGCESEPIDENSIFGYTDSDYATDLSTRRSVSGSIFMLAGGPISWSSKLQPSVSQSSTEAEYVASAEAAKEAIWLRQLMCDLKQDISEPTTLFIDNRGAQMLAKNPVNHANTKHIDVRNHFIRECVENGSIVLKSVASADNVADICTKALGKNKIMHFRSMMGLTRLSDKNGALSEGGC
jgi:transposase InsO family protein